MTEKIVNYRCSCDWVNGVGCANPECRDLECSNLECRRLQLRARKKERVITIDCECGGNLDLNTFRMKEKAVEIVEKFWENSIDNGSIALEVANGPDKKKVVRIFGCKSETGEYKATREHGKSMFIYEFKEGTPEYEAIIN